MKITLTIFPFLFISLFSMAQNSPCAFDWIAKMKIQQATEIKIQNGIQNLSLQKAFDTIKTIPVVVHVIHTGGSENISEAQIQSQIQILNEDFGKLPGTPGDGNGVDTKVRFCLAKRDPNGNCTNGIVRVNSTLANHKAYERPLLKQLSFWDNERYLNIYVVKSITGSVLGYSSFPGGAPDEDGIVVRNNYFGNMGTASTSLGRTMTHEAGHWFGLYHTFNNGCGTDVCLDGDNVCDTPPVATANFGCPASSNSCSNDSPDLPDLLENYMDYTDDNCKNMLTQGQAERIASTLINIRTNIWSEANLISTGCDSNYVAPSTCGITANFVTLTQDICIGNSINFSDLSLNDATSWSWEFPGGTPANSTSQNPTITYNTLGNFDVKLIATDGVTTDSITFSNYVTVSNPGIGDPLPFSEGFEAGFPQNGLSLFDADGLGSWELDSIAPKEGNYCIKIDNLNNPCCGSVDEVYLPYFDLSTVGSTPYMKFVWAYAKSDQLYSDELIVQASVDCGNNWNQVFYRSQSSLVTGPTQTTSFIPDSSEWNNAVIGLGAYSSEQYVLLKIINVSDGGNNLYIDNINIGNISVGTEEQIAESDNWKLFPNPGSNVLSLNFDNSFSGQIKIIDISGRTVSITDVYNIKHTKINIEHLQKGIYQLLEINNNITDSKSFIKI